MPSSLRPTALNPELTPQIPAASKYKIYVSALTTISLDDHNCIPPSRFVSHTMQIVVVKCPHALRWLLRAVFKV